jgi:hypothetical protein
MLGDAVKEALVRVGVTEDRVSRFLGFPCGCGERAEKLNLLHSWSKRVLMGKVDRAKELLNRILEEAM